MADLPSLNQDLQAIPEKDFYPSLKGSNDKPDAEYCMLYSLINLV